MHYLEGWIHLRNYQPAKPTNKNMSTFSMPIIFKTGLHLKTL